MTQNVLIILNNWKRTSKLWRRSNNNKNNKNRDVKSSNKTDNARNNVIRPDTLRIWLTKRKMIRSLMTMRLLIQRRNKLLVRKNNNNLSLQISKSLMHRRNKAPLKINNKMLFQNNKARKLKLLTILLMVKTQLKYKNKLTTKMLLNRFLKINLMQLNKNRLIKLMKSLLMTKLFHPKIKNRINNLLFKNQRSNRINLKIKMIVLKWVANRNNRTAKTFDAINKVKILFQITKSPPLN